MTAEFPTIPDPNLCCLLAPQGKLVRTKGVVLRGWIVRHKEVKSKDKYFILFNDSGNTNEYMYMYMCTYMCMYM